MQTETPFPTAAPPASKEIPFADAPAFMDSLRAKGLRIVQCHGTFDLVHPGHIIHFEEARALGDVLVVTLTASRYVNKGPGRPYFDDEMRVKSIGALAIVDYVVLIPFAAAVEAIECVRPNIYCKGKEYEDQANDVTGNIRDDVAAVTRVGGEVRYVGSVVFSSTKLLNNQLSSVPQEIRDFCRSLSGVVSGPDVIRAVQDFSRLRVLVVGDIIFDRYTSVYVQGLTSKNRIMSARHIEDETHLGGALAVYRHIRAFAEQTDFLSLTGTEQWVAEAISGLIPEQRNHVLKTSDFTTVVKQRFVEKSKRTREISKLFALNYINARSPNRDTGDRICRKLESIIANYDIVVVADFGHGLMLEKVRELVQEKARFLTLNCQTNSNNHGFNIIDRQYQRVDAFTLDEEEILLSCGRRHPSYVDELLTLKNKLGASYAWLTRGGHETIGISGREDTVFHMPVLEQQVTDTVGAGDAVFSLVSLAAAALLPVNVATFIGQLAGAQKVRILGNAEGVRMDRLLKWALSLLSY